MIDFELINEENDFLASRQHIFAWVPVIETWIVKISQSKLIILLLLYLIVGNRESKPGGEYPHEKDGPVYSSTTITGVTAAYNSEVSVQSDDRDCPDWNHNIGSLNERYQLAHARTCKNNSDTESVRIKDQMKMEWTH